MQESKAVTLTIAQWQVVWNAIAQRPYGEVSGIAEAIRAQLSDSSEQPGGKRL